MQQSIMSSKLVTIWKKDGCAEHYICATALYLISMLSQSFSIIINHVISAPGHDSELEYGFNTIDKRFLFQWISTVQILDEKIYDTQIVIHTGTCPPGVSLAT